MIKEELSGRMRMIRWMDGHDMLFRGRSEDKEEDEDQSAFEVEKKKVIYVLNFIFIAEAL